MLGKAPLKGIFALHMGYHETSFSLPINHLRSLSNEWVAGDASKTVFVKTDT